VAVTRVTRFQWFVASLTVLVAFNLLMIALAFGVGSSGLGAVFAAWFAGDFALSLIALHLTDR
jgi:hypothetical protein